MPLKDRISFIGSPAEVDAFLAANPTAAIFKVGNCHKTQETFTHVQEHLDPREDLKLGIIKVIESRSASNHVAAMTGIEHESPQIILFKDGKNVFDRDNWDITSAAMSEGMKTVPVLSDAAAAPATLPC
jgi:bacillithiol system protein YtxJ